MRMVAHFMSQSKTAKIRYD